MLNTDPPWIFGHRGAAGLVPENTLPSLDRAFSLGVDGVEVDVQWAHNRLWLLHDDTLDRTTNASGTLLATSPQALESIDAGQGALLPTLSDALVLLPPEVVLNIELKGPGTGGPAVDVLKQHPEPTVLLSSFRWEELDAYRAAGGDAPVAVLSGRLTDAAMRTAERLQAWSIHVSARWLTRSAVSRIQAAGFRVLVYTVNDLAVARRLCRWGVHGLFTDYPDRISRAALRDLQGSPTRRDG